MKYTRNAYGAKITSVEKVNHERPTRKVTWQYEGRAYNAKTVPGSTATTQADNANLDEGLFRIILNGRHQIILIEVWDDEPLEALVAKQQAVSHYMPNGSAQCGPCFNGTRVGVCTDPNCQCGCRDAKQEAARG